MNWKPLFYSSAISMLIVGCTVGPNYVPPNMTVPRNFSEALSTTQPANRASAAQAVRWWTTFNDPVLNSLIDRSLQSNLDLRAAESRIRQARAQYGVTLAGEYPTVSTSGSFSRRRGSTALSASSSSSAFRSASSSAGKPSNLYQAGFDATWEIDVFGGVRRGIEAAESDIEATVEDRRDVLVILLSEVARTYIDYRGFARQIAIATENVKAQKETLNVTRRQFEAGLKTATELDVARAQALVATTESQIPELDISLRQTAHSLALLLGKDPQALLEELGTAQPIPAAQGTIPRLGVPAELLRRRPDIRRAERQLAAATARIGVASADLFPKFSLTGSLGLESVRFKDIASYGSRFWSVGPSVSWPIFDAGRIRANIRIQNALQEQAFIRYQNAVLVSLQDVENSLVAYSREQTRRTSLNDAVEANKRAVTLATQRYNAGLTDFLSVLDAQRSLYAAQDQMVLSDRFVSEDLVALYKALGGGWEVMEGQPQ
jgi:multidrug efflux system outer membrane protein